MLYNLVMEKKFAEWLNKKFLEEALANKTRPNVSKLARRLGTSQSVVTRWLNGDVEPSNEYLLEIAKIYGLEAYDILGRERPKTLVRALYFGPTHPMSDEEMSKAFKDAKNLVAHIKDQEKREETMINFLASRGIEKISIHIEEQNDIDDELDLLIDELTTEERLELMDLIKERRKKGTYNNEAQNNKSQPSTNPA